MQRGVVRILSVLVHRQRTKRNLSRDLSSQREKGKSHHSAIRSFFQVDRHHFRLLEGQQAFR
jgi:hypothetical protein